jgi:dTDP-4-amino-4,6-dideoxygalactose transaminase
VLEDAAQAHGAADPASGSAACAYSFYPTKKLGGVGDGGAVVTDDDAMAANLRLLRAHGLTDAYVHTRVSTNSRLSELEAAALRVGLTRLAAQNARRREIASRYRAAAPNLRWQSAHERHVYHLCVARITERDAFRSGVPFETGVHYRRALTQQPAYSEFVEAPCPEAEAWAAECVSLPCFPEMGDDEIEAVCRALN